MDTSSSNVVVKNVTLMYVAAKTKRYKMAIKFDLFKGLLLLIFALFPIVSIGEYNLENSYLFVFNYLKNFINRESTSQRYLLYFLIFSINVIFWGAINVWRAISNFNKKVNLGKIQVYINKNDENFVVSLKFIFKKIVLGCLLLCIAYVLISINNSKLQVYGFTSHSSLIIMLFFVLSIMKNVLCSYITLKYDEKSAYSEEDIILRAEKRQKTKKIKKTRRKRDIKWYLGCLFGDLVLIVIIIAICCFSYYHTMYNGYTYMGGDSVAGWVLSPEDEGLLRFDVETLKGGYGRMVKEDGFGCKSIKLELNYNGKYEKNTKNFTFYGDSYDFAQAKIEELEKEILKLWPKDNTEDALKKYLKQIEDMKNAIKILRGKTIYPYEYVDFIDGYLVDLQYNASGKDEIKWGVKQEGIKSLIFKEKISLTDRYCKNKKSMDRFAVGTDFNNELIVARVRYSDGSVRISKIKPKNIEELNSASAGVHLLKWEDSWGKYEKEITLY